MRVFYDEHADVLYIILSQAHGACRYVEAAGGIVTRIDKRTQRIVGVTIYHFKQRSEQGETFSVPDIGNDLSGARLMQLDAQAPPETASSSGDSLRRS